MTYPTIFHMGSGVRDLLDSVFDVWVISQNVQKLINLQFHDYFDANIFFPYKNTLVYSNHYFTQSLLALPVYLISKNPILTYNFILLFSFFTSALGMFLLARYLTGSPGASLIAGLIFAFSPFMMSHFVHLQILTAGGIPLAFLFLHKFFHGEQIRHLLLFTLFFTLQFLASGHYALYLTLFCGLYILIHTLTHKKYREGRYWMKMGLFLLISIMVLGPFVYQYIRVQQDIGFSRVGATGATLSQYLATSSGNRLYGQLTKPWQKIEGALFPGILALILAMTGLWVIWKKPLRNLDLLKDQRLIYTVILISSFLFGFGMKGPYYFLHRYVPGFNGVRVAQRFHIMVMFVLAVLAAQGLHHLFAGLKNQKKFLALGLVWSGILLEYASIPIPMFNLPVKSEIPPVYQHIKKIAENEAIIEFPIPEKLFKRTRIESLRMYYSIYHQKKMVNGRSSYFPPLYYEIRQRWKYLPIKELITDLNTLGVKYVIFHSNLMRPDRFDTLMFQLSQLQGRIRFLNKYGEAWLYEITGGYPVSKKETADPPFQPLSHQGWTVHASTNTAAARLALDGKVLTWWQSPPQKDGDYFMIDLNQSHPLKRLSLRLSPNLPCSYPLGYRVEVSGQGRQWTLVASSNRTRIPITEFLTPRRITLTIDLDPCRARYIKITNTGQYRKQIWTISEIEVFR